MAVGAHFATQAAKPPMMQAIQHHPGSNHSYSSNHLQCEDCGHICVTATEKTSEIQHNQMSSMELESEENRRKHYSPLNQNQM